MAAWRQLVTIQFYSGICPPIRVSLACAVLIANHQFKPDVSASVSASQQCRLDVSASHQCQLVVCQPIISVSCMWVSASHQCQLDVSVSQLSVPVGCECQPVISVIGCGYQPVISVSWMSMSESHQCQPASAFLPRIIRLCKKSFDKAREWWIFCFKKKTVTVLFSFQQIAVRQ